ncbi:hypothetical protein [Veillonella magna]|uniref:hypothetical protein n=1 Tax=Veillonella magna TaxID=464322 RepID=UPI0026DA8C69|nr:hypothetical protein [Veillonella magna]
MNYLKEVNAFHVWSMLHPEMSMSARILWYVLMHFNNIGFWQKTFSLSMDTLASATGLSRAKLTEAHVVLQKAGRIRYMLCDDKKSAIYEIIPLTDGGIQSTSQEPLEEKLEEELQNPLPDTSHNESCDIPKAKPQGEQQDGQKCESQDERRSESRDGRQSESRDGRIHRQDKTRQDISKETTVKKGEVAKGKMKTEPKRCFPPPSVAMVRAGCEERICCIVGQGIVTAAEYNRFMQRETRGHEP